MKISTRSSARLQWTYKCTCALEQICSNYEKTLHALYKNNFDGDEFLMILANHTYVIHRSKRSQC